jgi:predicted O-methyltransferase YrrM
MTEYPNWFEYVQPNFEEFLTPLAGKDDLKFLQLGVFTGDASVWMAKNILTGKGCWLIDVDTWQGSDEADHKSMDFDDVYAAYKLKTALYKTKIKNTIKTFKSTTTWFLTSVRKDPDYDFIYIDADHTTVGVILDAELAWPQLKSGGIMAFDDYTWVHESGDPRLAPQVGIDLFLHRHLGNYELLAKNHQVWVRKL